MRIRLFSIMAFVVYSFTAFAQFAGGAGTEKSPYLVSDAYQLSDVRNYPSCYFKQTSDIDLSEWIKDNSPQKGWSPIGTEESPFTGTYDGAGFVIKGLKIFRYISDNVGLFGRTDGNAGTLKNIVLQGAYIEAASNVGFICGSNVGNMVISSCVVNGGQIKGSNNVGGIVGSTTSDINNCYVFADVISATGDCGGIAGFTVHSVYDNYIYANISSSGNAGGVVGKSYQYRTNHDGSDISINGELHDCRFDGQVISSTFAGGIIGWDNFNHHYSTVSSYKPVTYYHEVNDGLNINKCFVGSGKIKSSDSASGIVGYRAIGYHYPEPGVQTTNSVCATNTIEAPKCYRIQSVTGGQNNIASLNTTLIINGAQDDNIEDNDYNGIAYGDKTLFRSSTYIGLNWDMTNTWTIDEGNSYPYLKNMSIQPTIKDYFISNKSIIKGACMTDGQINIIKNGIVYSCDILDGQFEINIGAVNAGDTLYYNAIEKGKHPSVTNYFIAESKIVEPEIITGDSNGDGAVDAADVVSIVNYILGKPSSSFNEKNADANGDGQILVDDAVGTVNIIMNEQ